MLRPDTSTHVKPRSWRGERLQEGLGWAPRIAPPPQGPPSAPQAPQPHLSPKDPGVPCRPPNQGQVTPSRTKNRHHLGGVSPFRSPEPSQICSGAEEEAGEDSGGEDTEGGDVGGGDVGGGDMGGGDVGEGMQGEGCRGRGCGGRVPSSLTLEGCEDPGPTWQCQVHWSGFHPGARPPGDTGPAEHGSDQLPGAGVPGSRYPWAQVLPEFSYFPGPAVSQTHGLGYFSSSYFPDPAAVSAATPQTWLLPGQSHAGPGTPLQARTLETGRHHGYVTQRTWHGTPTRDLKTLPGFPRGDLTCLVSPARTLEGCTHPKGAEGTAWGGPGLWGVP